MLESMEKKAFFLLLLTLCLILAASGFLEWTGRAQYASRYDPSLPDGALVWHEGRVEKVTRTKEGNHLLLRVSGVNVFIPSPASEKVEIAPNSVVRVVGRIQTYRGEREVVVTDEGEIEYIPAGAIPNSS